MFEYIEFYTKNLSNLTILLVIGAVIAILDITFRNVVKGVYLNVRDNIRLRHGLHAHAVEGMENNNAPPGGGGGEGECPKDCKDVLELKTKLTELIQNAANLQKDIQTNNAVIKNQQNMIEIMKRNVDKVVQKSNK
jgi:hypothetical protein